MGIFDFFKSGNRADSSSILAFNMSGGKDIKNIGKCEREFYFSGIPLLDELTRLASQNETQRSPVWIECANKILEADPKYMAVVTAGICARLPLSVVEGPQSQFRHCAVGLGEVMDVIYGRSIKDFPESVLAHFQTFAWASWSYLNIQKRFEPGSGVLPKWSQLLFSKAPVEISGDSKIPVKLIHDHLDTDEHRLFDEPYWGRLRSPSRKLLGIAEQGTHHYRLQSFIRTCAKDWNKQIRDVAGPAMTSHWIGEKYHELDPRPYIRLGTDWLKVNEKTAKECAEFLVRCLETHKFISKLGNTRSAFYPDLNLEVSKHVKSYGSIHARSQQLLQAMTELSSMKLELCDEDFACVISEIPNFPALQNKRILSQAFICCKNGNYQKTHNALKQLSLALENNKTTRFKSLLVGVDAKLLNLEEALARKATSPNGSPQDTRSPNIAKADEMSSTETAERRQYLDSIRQNFFKPDHLPKSSPLFDLPAAELELFCEIYADSVGLYQKSAPSAKWLTVTKNKFSSHPALPSLFAKLLEGEFEPPRYNYLSPLYLLNLPMECETAIRGLIYLSLQLDHAMVGKVLSDYARKICFRTDPGRGIHNEKLGNACLWALIHRPDGQGVSHLARLLVRIKYPKVKKKIEAALEEAAQKAGVARSELEEMALADYGLDANGRVTLPVGDGSATISLDDAATTDIVWQRAGGKPSASVPEALKPQKVAIKQVRDLVKEIDADISVLVQRIQHSWLEDRSWTAETWMTVYTLHPLRVPFAKRLVWNITRDGKRFSAIWTGTEFQDVSSRVISSGDAMITLWHPVTCPTAETLAWRIRLRQLGITQPFKQAHREVYLVTDAERRTGTYSNRFAGHIIKQHQFMMLARLNNWRVTHKIAADVQNDEPAHIVLRAHGIVAEYWTEPAGGDDAEFSDGLAYLYLTTDQLRFYRIAEGPAGRVETAHGPAHGHAISIQDVPPLVLSEIMRHCDLFVGVASVANDPTWMDAGADAQHHNQWRRGAGADYWRSESVGELTASAETRREVLEELLPSLKIGPQCKLEGRFLHVKGKLRSYKIHLGSGNILMDPNDAYLCIVPGSKQEGKIRLPFEGDKMLSIILSKALMLANDDKITDSGIISQINRR